MAADPQHNATATPEADHAGQAAPDAQRTDELMQIIDAYNRVTERLRSSHETLTSEVRRLQSELASANAALQRSRRLAALGEMAAGIAHEVRNPLASIRLYAGMLAEDLADRPESRDLAEKIAEAVRGLDGIVNDVLTFARQTGVRPVEQPARELFDRALESVGPMFEQRGIDARYHIDPADERLCADRELLQQALVNLLRNAAQAMPDGGAVTLAARRDEQTAQLTVRDTGPGIDAAQIDRIFNPFVTTRATGTGLGLAIVHRIADAHGGSIEVHNDGGAVFTLTLPRAPAAIAPEGAEAQPAENPATIGTGSLSASAKEPDALHSGTGRQAARAAQAEGSR